MYFLTRFAAAAIAPRMAARRSISRPQLEGVKGRRKSVVSKGWFLLT